MLEVSVTEIVPVFKCKAFKILRPHMTWKNKQNKTSLLLKNRHFQHIMSYQVLLLMLSLDTALFGRYLQINRFLNWIWSNKKFQTFYYSYIIMKNVINFFNAKSHAMFSYIQIFTFTIIYFASVWRWELRHSALLCVHPMDARLTSPWSKQKTTQNTPAFHSMMFSKETGECALRHRGVAWVEKTRMENQASYFTTILDVAPIPSLENCLPLSDSTHSVAGLCVHTCWRCSSYLNIKNRKCAPLDRVDSTRRYYRGDTQPKTDLKLQAIFVAEEDKQLLL